MNYFLIKLLYFSIIELIIFNNNLVLSSSSKQINRDLDKPKFQLISSSDKLEDDDISESNSKIIDDKYEDDAELETESIKKPNQFIPPYADIPLDYRRVCIYPNWSILRDSNMAKIYPEDIDPFLCTHIHYAYANIDVRNLQLSPSQFQDINSGEHGGPLYERIMNLRQKNPNLKILISIGGWFAKSTPFNRILSSANSRNTFIQNALNFIAHHKFDGIDLQWEYPGAIESGASSDSKQRFTSLIKHFYKTFREDFKSNYRRYFLSAFVPADEARIDAGYQVKTICKYLDYLSVSTYDFAGAYDSKTGYNSALYSRNGEQNSVNNSMKLWMERGCPSKKLLVGVPTYAKAFKIVKKLSSNLVYLGIDSEPFVSPSLYTSEEGILSYYEVCEMMANKESRVYWDDLAEVPFSIISNFNESQKMKSNTQLWISYEDSKSARKKAEYVKKMSLGGVSIWSLDMDDFKGWFCNLGPYPIINAIKEEFEHKLRPLDNSETTSKITKTYEKFSSSKSIELNTKINNKTKITPNKTPTSISTVNSKNYKNATIPMKRPSTSLSDKNEKTDIDDKPKFKFKAVREIKLLACLDNNKCSLNKANIGYNCDNLLNFLYINILKFLVQYFIKSDRM